MTANSSPSRTILRTLARSRVVRFVALLFLLATVFRFTNWLESRVFYFPTPAPAAEMRAPKGAEDVFFPGPDGTTLHGWFFPAVTKDPGPHPAVLHCHGNAGNIDGHAEYSMFLATKGYGVFVFDYRGYGASEPGPHHRHALMTDTRAALDAMAKRSDVDPERIGVLGVSIGCVFAAHLAATDSRVKACVLAAPFASWPSIAGTHAPVLGPVLVRGGLDPVDSVRGMQGKPLLVVHGDADEIIPVSHGERVVTAATSAGVRATFLPRPGVHHNDVLIGDTVSQSAVEEFLRAAFTGR